MFLSVELERFLYWWLLLGQQWFYCVRAYSLLKDFSIPKELSLFSLNFKFTFGLEVLIGKLKVELIFIIG